MAKTNHANKKSMTVKQMIHILSQMPEDLEIVVEGDRLIDPHVITDVLPPEDSEELIDTPSSKTVLLSIGGLYS